MKMDNRLVMIFVFAVVASLLLLSGCKGKTDGKTNNAVDMTTPPPLPEESGTGGEEEQLPTLPSSGGQQPEGLPLLG